MSDELTTVRFLDGGLVQMDRSDYDKLMATQPPAVGVDIDYTAEEVDAVIDAATERGTRHVPIECIEQMRMVLHAALRTGGGAA